MSLPSALAGVLLLALVACAAPPASTPTPSPAASTAVSSPVPSPSIQKPSPSATTSHSTPSARSTPPQPSENESSPAATSPNRKPPLAGKVIVIDPGHNGRYRASFNTRQVPAGNGRTKACNSSGTAAKGLPEHTYNWKQAQVLRRVLARLGAEVVLTRADDDSLGPCVNQRAQIANDAGADLMISLHADGNRSRSARGFHVIRSTSMAGGKELEQDSLRLARLVRDTVETDTAMPRSTYIGDGTGLSPRSDIATLNLLADTPGIMLEVGNMQSSADLTLLSSTRFRDRLAAALADAAVAFLT